MVPYCKSRTLRDNIRKTKREDEKRESRKVLVFQVLSFSIPAEKKRYNRKTNSKQQIINR